MSGDHHTMFDCRTGADRTGAGGRRGSACGVAR
jgi:hypothetical protein